MGLSFSRTLTHSHTHIHYIITTIVLFHLLRRQAKSDSDAASERNWSSKNRVWLIHAGGFSAAVRSDETLEGSVQIKLDSGGNLEVRTRPMFDREWWGGPMGSWGGAGRRDRDEGGGRDRKGVGWGRGLKCNWRTSLYICFYNKSVWTNGASSFT